MVDMNGAFAGVSGVSEGGNTEGRINPSVCGGFGRKPKPRAGVAVVSIYGARAGIRPAKRISGCSQSPTGGTWQVPVVFTRAIWEACRVTSESLPDCQPTWK